MKLNPSEYLVVDGDILSYQVASVCEEVTEWDEFNVSKTFNKQRGAQVLTETMERVLRNMEAAGFPRKKVIYTLSGPSDENFRREIYPEYKTNRSAAQRPVGLGAMRNREMILKCLPVGSLVQLEDNLEADDLIGMYLGQGFVCLSNDKDLKTCPGTLGYITADYAGDHALVKRGEKSSNYYLLCQVLSGDSTDGIPGLPGVGPVTAEKILQSADQSIPLWDFMQAQYEAKGLTWDDLWTTFRLVYILRTPEDLYLNHPKYVIPGWDHVIMPKDGAKRQRKAKDKGTPKVKEVTQ